MRPKNHICRTPGRMAAPAPQQPPVLQAKQATEGDVKQAVECIDRQQLYDVIREIKVGPGD